ncbi:MAG: DUF2934 domain-containing protein [Alphaproteobacteria bacterium]|nr:MAG: DUF2934 domain-containing protein [Alphaproteobacteria bacterium]TMJ35936.1 MAG: DUF2934 domain-containing protein [Alphaproteobacteria bacterium]
MIRKPITEERIRERAYRLWLEEGQPQGKDAEHWEKARELLAIESDPEEGKEGVAEGYNKPGPWGEPVEQIAALENQGEFPTTTDQGEQEIPKQRRPTASKQRPRIAKKRPM